MAITIHAKWGPEESGDELFRGELVDTLTIGRAADNALVLQSPAVGSYHLELSEEDGRVVLDVVDHQPVYLVEDGHGHVRWRGRQVLFEGGGAVELDLGFPIDPRGADEPGFYEQGALRLVVQDLRARRRQRAHRTERILEAVGHHRQESALNFFALLAAVVGIGGVTIGAIKLGVDRLEENQQTLLAVSQRNTQLLETNASLFQQALESDFVLANGSAPLLVADGSEAVWYLGLREADSVVESFRGVGTAWLLADGATRWVVTNAHVLRELNGQLRDTLTPVLRRGDDEFELGSVLAGARIHPLYDRFEQVRDDDRRRSWTNPYDVALFAPPEGLEQKPSLQVAPTPILESLEVQTDVHYFGYPFENLTTTGPDRSRPAPLFDRGYVAQVSDAMRRAYVAPSLRHLLVVRIPAVGGASGSPVLQDDGQVVGMLFGADMLAFGRDAVVSAADAHQSRYRVNVGYARALRADVILSMLEGRDPIDDGWWTEAVRTIGTAADELARERDTRLRQLRGKNLCQEVGPARSIEMTPPGLLGFRADVELEPGHWLASVQVPDHQAHLLSKAIVIPPGAKRRRDREEKRASSLGFAFLDFEVPPTGGKTRLLVDGDPGAEVSVRVERCTR